MVNIETFGLPADTVCKGNKTRYQSGPHPIWENPEEDFVFEKVSCLTFVPTCLQIVVCEKCR